MSDSPILFLTGFPGFIAKQLVRRIIAKHPAAQMTFLVQSHLATVARSAIDEIAGEYSGFSERATLIEGDITLARLGMDESTYQQIVEQTQQIWHLAAIYDLAVAEQIAYKVNVTGTEMMLDMCEACANLQRFHYVSTCYVSGNRKGRVLETELDEGQTFKNHYESTKFWAEVEVRRRMETIPTTIYRPGIVVGDSKTGYTDKYDGPYFVIRLLMKMPSWLPMVNLGQGDAIVNMVPVDFLVDAMVAVADNPDAIGHTIHLADPAAYTAREVVAAILAELGRRKPIANVPSGLVERLLKVKWLRRTIEIPEQAVVYFNHPVDYDTTNQAKFLDGSGVRCPDFAAILPTLIAYVRANPQKGFLDGRQL